MTVFEGIYLAGLVFAEGLRFRYRRERLGRPLQPGRSGHGLPAAEKLVLLLVALGIWFLPAVLILTAWLDFADYDRPAWLGCLSVVPWATSLWLRWLAQRELGRNWSSTLAIQGEHRLVTTGIYQYLRHPIYTALWLGALAQALLLPNWLVGLGGLLAATALTLLRIPREEAMMVDEYGVEYQAYMRRTGGLVPRLRPVRGDLE